MARIYGAWIVGLLSAACVPWSAGDIEFAFGGTLFRVDDAGNAVSLLQHGTGRECLLQGRRFPIATIVADGATHTPSSVRKTQTGVEICFREGGTVLDYTIEFAADWVTFRLAAIAGGRPERVTLLQVAPAVVDTVGSRLNCAYDETTAVCIMAASMHPYCHTRGRRPVMLSAVVQDHPGPRLEGASAALIVCETDRFKDVAREVSQRYGLLTNETEDGVPVKDSELVRGSYFFLSFGEADVPRVVELCRQSGIRQVMLSSGAWCRSVGHYLFNERRYPDGLQSLRRTVAGLHAHGILVGMHSFVSKVSKRDPYISPKPTHRFWRRFDTTLADAISAEATEIRVTGDLSEWAGAAPSASRYWEGGVAKHREVVIGDEIIAYDAIGPEGVWNTFLGCKRGAWQTRSTSHRAGAPATHYGVDGCINGYIIDQETDLMAEVADRIAHIFNTCEFDMVYFDGGEDVDRRRYRYYVSNFQMQAMRRFRKRPVVHMGTIMTHRLWHSFARSSTVDTYLNTIRGQIIGGKPPEQWPTVKDHINRSVNYMLRVRRDMMPGELGWFGIWPRQENTDGLQFDEIEYLMAKSLGFDVPISLQTGFASMESHPLTAEILRIVRMYEEMRLGEGCADAVRLRLRRLDQDVVCLNWQGERHFVDVAPMETVGGSREVRAFVGAFGKGSVAMIWHFCRGAAVTLPMSAGSAALVDLYGSVLPWEEAGEDRVVLCTDTTRRALICPDLSPGALREMLNSAEVVTLPAEVLVVEAEDALSLTGKMALGSAVGVVEAEASGDVLVCAGNANYKALNPWYASYSVEIPHDGVWWVWGRVRYPTGSDDSFGIVPEGEPPTLQGKQVLGNCGVNGKRWHWTARGGGSTSVPPGSPITLKLDKGTFHFRIYGRESRSDLELTPRLDQILFTDDAMFVPDD